MVYLAVDDKYPWIKLLIIVKSQPSWQEKIHENAPLKIPPIYTNVFWTYGNRCWYKSIKAVTGASVGVNAAICY